MLLSLDSRQKKQKMSVLWFTIYLLRFLGKNFANASTQRQEDVMEGLYSNNSFNTMEIYNEIIQKTSDTMHTEDVIKSRVRSKTFQKLFFKLTIIL